MRDEFVLRPYTAADRDACLAIWRAASEAGHPFLSRAELDADQLLVRDIYLQKAEITLACDASGPVGFVALIDAFIGGLFILPAQHRRGVGRLLLGAAARDRPVLTVEVYAKNVDALQFYDALGFARVGARPCDDQGRGFALLRLQRGQAG